jgi:hypothetical protein
MIFLHKDEGLEIKLNWKERFLFFLRGSLKFEQKSTHDFYSHFMKLITDAVEKYGDTTKHGIVKIDKEVKTK